MSKPALVQIAEENCAYIEKLRTELAVREAEVRSVQKRLDDTNRAADVLNSQWAALESQTQHDHQLAAEWQQRANELGAEVEVLRDKTADDARRIRELEVSLHEAERTILDLAGRVQRFSPEVEAITNSMQQLADDWYADDLERRELETGCRTPSA